MVRNDNRVHSVISLLIWIFLFAAAFRFLISYLPYFIKTKIIYSKSQLNQEQQTSILKHLQQLNSMPIIGRFFYQQKIRKLVDLRDWEKVISQSEAALQLYTHQSSFSIWYYKGMAQCLLKKYDKCQQSAYKAIYYSSSKNKKVAKDLLDFVYQKQKNNQIISNHEQQQEHQNHQNSRIQKNVMKKKYYRKKQIDHDNENLLTQI